MRRLNRARTIEVRLCLFFALILLAVSAVGFIRENQENARKESEAEKAKQSQIRQNAIDNDVKGRVMSFADDITYHDWKQKPGSRFVHLNLPCGLVRQRVGPPDRMQTERESDKTYSKFIYITQHPQSWDAHEYHATFVCVQQNGRLANSITAVSLEDEKESENITTDYWSLQRRIEY